ncbi:hypothetical protein [Caulobacter sp. FWC2]|uniref:hypothetical protein n=1 Tax=Caulobacter sp. FWC2 TaxID=69664 RepID=UPI0011789ED0|nr:hypothetical protein [Caulobacter sp. FWC2]
MANAFAKAVAQQLKGRFAQDAIIHWPAAGGLSRTGATAAPTTQTVRTIITNRTERINGAIVQTTTAILPATERSLIGASLTVKGSLPRKIATSENIGGSADDAAFQKVTLT